MKKLILMCLFTSWVATSQHRIIVTSSDDVIPLKKGETAFEAVNRIGLMKTNKQTLSCDQISFGFTPDTFKCNLPFIGFHKDTWGEWFLAPTNGRIDTFYFQSNDQNDMKDSSVIMRIFRSNIYPGHGPGYGPYPSPRVAWGYYIDTSDTDQGITPFRDQANGGTTQERKIRLSLSCFSQKRFISKLFRYF